MLHFLIFLVCVYVFVLISNAVGWKTMSKVLLTIAAIFAALIYAHYEHDRRWTEQRQMQTR